MENKRPTQCDRIIIYIKDFGSITTLEAFTELGIVRLGARISELRAKGLPIDDKPEIVKNRYGESCHIKRYFLREVNATNDNRCVCCGVIIPEGRQVCPTCENKSIEEDEKDFCLNCGKKECKGECAELKAHISKLKEIRKVLKNLHKKQQNTVV